MRIFLSYIEHNFHYMLRLEGGMEEELRQFDAAVQSLGREMGIYNCLFNQVPAPYRVGGVARYPNMSGWEYWTGDEDKILDQRFEVVERERIFGSNTASVILIYFEGFISRDPELVASQFSSRRPCRRPRA